MRLILPLFCLTILMTMAFTPVKKDKIERLLPDAYVAVPEGDVIVDGVSARAGDFYISRKEVSNLDYAEFLWHLDNEKNADKLKVASIVSANWERIDGHLEPMVNSYHTHPSYRDYPVVNVSHEAAMLYCKWLEEILSERFGDEYKVNVTLPSRAQWIRAARGDNVKATYAWGGSYLRNSKGQLLCNFRHIGAESIHLNQETGNYEITASDEQIGDNLISPCESFSSNDLGLFNMNGNVAEMLNEEGVAAGGSWNDTGYDVRIESTRSYNEPSPMVGFRPVLQIEKVEK